MSRQGGSVKEKLKSYKRTPGSFIVMLLVLRDRFKFCVNVKN